MPPRDKPTLADALRYAPAGMMLIAPMLGFGALGWWVDRRWGSAPWAMVAGLLLGMVGGFVNFLQLVLPSRGKGGKTGGPPGDGGSGPPAP